MIPRLTICGIHELRSVIAGQDQCFPITHVISLWNPPLDTTAENEISDYLDLFATSLPGAGVLNLQFDDVSRPVPGRLEPRVEHVREILRFAREAVRERGDRTHLLVHCQAGISRSTASALAILAQSNPDEPSASLVAHIAGIRRWIYPNKLIVRIADELLARPDPLLPAVIACNERGMPG